MKAKELIEELKKFDPDLEVLVQCESYYDCSYLGPAEYVKPAFHWVNHEKLRAIAITQTRDEV